MRTIVFCGLIFTLTYFASSASVVDHENLDMVCLPKKEMESREDVCITKNCAVTATNLILSIDPEVDPCEDFFQFACKDFVRRHPVADDQQYISTWLVFNTYFNIQLQGLLETLNPDKEPDIVRQVQEGYHVCLNISYQPEKEFEALKNLTRDVYDWPLATGQDWKKNPKTLTEYFENIEQHGFPNPLFKIYFDKQQNDTSKYKAILRFDYLLVFNQVKKDKDTKMNNAMINLLKNLATHFGNDDSDNHDKHLEDMKKANDWIDEKYDLIISTNDDDEITIGQLNEMFDNKIDWVPVLNAKMPKEIFQFSEENFVAYRNIQWLKTFFELFEKFDDSVVYNLLGWKAIALNYLIADGGDKGENLWNAFNREIDENYKPPASKTEKRGQYCAKVYQQYYPMVTTRIFVNKYIDKKDKDSADEMIQDIQQAYKNMIEESKWLDEATKQKALLKAEKIRRHIAYPDFIFDDEKLNEYHADAPPIQSTEFLNNLYRQAYKQRRQMIYSTYTIEDDLWTDDPLVINAFYDWNANAIWFPTGILQLPFFDSTRLAAVNYGSIGAVIGHEIGHGFDDSGSQHDEDGQKTNWWTDETGKIYKEKTTCFVKQFNNFCPEALRGDKKETFCVSGKGTLGENMADFTGLKAAYKAYKLWVKKHGKEKRLPGLQQYSPEQIFFLSFAYTWCENIPPDRWSERYKYDPHAPGEYRVIGTLSNSEEFRKVFNCPVGKMNRGNQSCTVW